MPSGRYSSIAHAGRRFAASLLERRRWPWLAFTLVTLLAIVHVGWICDDAFISARVVDNFLSLRGLRWNPAERVQAFTHPLWLLLMILARFVVHDAYWSLLGLSVLVSALCVGTIASTCDRSEPFFALVAGTLALSKSFVDFSSSGLENPLTHLLVVLLWREVRKPSPSLLQASVWVGLATLNRPDLILLFAPPLWVLIQAQPSRWSTQLRTVLAAFSPLLAWELFSLVYYGSFVPNTAIAKLGVALPRAVLIEHGFAYLVQPIFNDPISLLLLLTGLPLGLLRGARPLRALCAGAALYIVYVVSIGGDFMAGRFLSASVVVAVLALLELMPVPRATFQAALVVVALLLEAVSPTAIWTARLPHSASTEPETFKATCVDGVCDERAFYGPFTQWRNVINAQVRPPHPWALLGASWSKTPKRTRVSGAIGFRGFFAGPDVFVVDYHALSDPLVARLVHNPKLHDWRPGHFKRCVPLGYPEATQVGPAALADAPLRPYYQKIWLVTRGRLWSAERFRAIWQLNTSAARFTGPYTCRPPSLTTEPGPMP